MKQTAKLIVVMTVGPVGPTHRLEDILDTISSVLYYTSSDRKIIIQDNSSSHNVGAQLLEIFPELIVIRTPQNYGLSGGLYKAESLAYLFAHTMFNFQALMRMDTDALVIGEGLEDDAAAFFQANPNVGQIGTYMIGTNGEVSEFSWPRQQLLHEIGIRGKLEDAERAEFLRKLVSEAQIHGYQPGEHIIGGVSILNPRFIEKLVDQGLLLREELRRSVLQEDHIYSMLVKAVGMDLGEFGGPEHPLANRWKGLPASPQQLVEMGKKVIHSVRFWQDMKEPEIREFFRARRNSSAGLALANGVTLESAFDISATDGAMQ
jgi:hypothetical protein